MATVMKPIAEDIARAENLRLLLEERFVEQFDAHPKAYQVAAHRMDEQFPDIAKTIANKHKVEDWLWRAVRHNECCITFEELKAAVS